MNENVHVRFYLNGDTNGTLYEQSFESLQKYQEWLFAMEDSVELFSMNES